MRNLSGLNINMVRRDFFKILYTLLLLAWLLFSGSN